MSYTGYPFDGYDGSDESFEKLLDSDPAYRGTTDTAACERTVAAGTCTGCEKPAAELIPWSGERLCWDCTDLQLDLMARAVSESADVHVAVAR